LAGWWLGKRVRIFGIKLPSGLIAKFGDNNMRMTKNQCRIFGGSLLLIVSLIIISTKRAKGFILGDVNGNEAIIKGIVFVIGHH
jgi:hypothetical protein